jgi:hypothetical protein
MRILAHAGIKNRLPPKSAGLLEGETCMPTRPRQYLKIVKESLGALADRRRGFKPSSSSGRPWDDAEPEPDLPGFTNAHKTADALECFLLGYRLFPEYFAHLQLEEGYVLEDVASVLALVEKNGFIPGAYQYEATSQYTDFAADVIRLLLDFTYWADAARIKHELTEAADSVCARAVQFLVAAAKEREDGFCWGGTTSPDSPGHVYYTAKAATALAQVMRAQVRPNGWTRPDVERRIQGAGMWFSRRHEGGRYYADGNNETSDTIAGLYPIYGLALTWDLQDKTKLAEYFGRCVKDYWTWLDENLEAYNRREVFYANFLEKSNQPQVTEDRSTLGTCLAALSAAWDALSESSIRTPAFYGYLQDLAAAVAGERDELHKMWYRGEEYAVYATSSSIEGLLCFERFAHTKSVTQFTEMTLVDLVQTVLQRRSPEIIKLFTEEFRGMRDTAGPQEDDQSEKE